MKSMILAAAVCVFLFSGAFVMAQHQHQGAGNSCDYCGMDREKFAHSAMMIEYTDGTMAHVCSIHCAAVDLATKIAKTPKTVQVGDYNTKKMINAETACWTLGGMLPGVMTRRAKWAFEDNAACEKFAKEQGAKVVSYDDAMKAAFEDMYLDMKMIREKRTMKMEKGEDQQNVQYEQQNQEKKE